MVLGVPILKHFRVYFTYVDVILLPVIFTHEASFTVSMLSFFRLRQSPLAGRTHHISSIQSHCSNFPPFRNFQLQVIAQYIIHIYLVVSYKNWARLFKSNNGFS